MFDCNSLFVICVRKAYFNVSFQQLKRLPLKLQKVFSTLDVCVKNFRSTLHGLPIAESHLNDCLIIDGATCSIDIKCTIEAMEIFLTRVDFFDLCGRYALDEEEILKFSSNSFMTRRVFLRLDHTECMLLMERNATVKCRILELYNSTAQYGELNVYYDEVALECATNGFAQALDRSLMKMKENISVDESLLPKCVLLAIQNGHYHIANHIICEDNYDKAFYSIFPDGRVSATFFASLLDSDLLVQGDRIAISLLKYLPKLDVERLRRAIKTDKKCVKSGVIRRFDTMYSEILDQRDYPCDID